METSIALEGKPAAELQLHEQITIYFDALRIFNASKASLPKRSVKHRDFYDEVGVKYNQFLSYARDNVDMIEHPDFQCDPLHYQVAEACITPYGAEKLQQDFAATVNTKVPLATLPGIIHSAIKYLQSKSAC